MVEAERGSEQGFKPNGPIGSFGEGAALAFGAARIVGGHDDVDRTTRDAFDHRAPVLLGAERGPHLEEGPIGADVVLVQGQVIDGDRSGDRKAARLCGADQLKRCTA